MLLSEQKRGKFAARIEWQKGSHEEGEIHT